MHTIGPVELIHTYNLEESVCYVENLITVCL